MNKLVASSKIYIKNSNIPGAGRGVFAKIDIKKGQLIEKCPTIELPKNEIDNLFGNFLVTYLFYFGKKKERSVLVLGFGSVYNHSYEPNAVYKIMEKEKVIDFIALDDIKNGNEIRVNYIQENPESTGTLWFEVKK